MTDTYVDGNALGGPLGQVFAVDVTAAIGRCAACGGVNPIAGARVYLQAAGPVARCVSCGNVLIRVVTAPNRVFLDLRGVSFLEIALPDATPT